MEVEVVSIQEEEVVELLQLDKMEIQIQQLEVQDLQIVLQVHQ
jgi:hypothetical protein